MHGAFTTLGVDDGALPLPGATGSYTDIGGVIEIELGGMKIDPKDTTAIADAYKTFRAGRPDSGDLSFDIFYEKSVFAYLVALFKTRQNYNFQLTFPDGPDYSDPLVDSSTATFEGLFTDIPLAIPNDDESKCKIKVKISGEITFTEGS